MCLLGTSLIKANKELTYDAIVARSKNSLRIIFCILGKLLVVVQKAKLNHVRLYLRRGTGPEDFFLLPLVLVLPLRLFFFFLLGGARRM